jgi:glutamate 5-kinase
MERGKHLLNARRIVVKVGTASITEDLFLSDEKVSKIAEEVVRLRNSGKEVIIVSSGAIAAGIRNLGLKARPRDLNMLQAAAAIGQNELMRAYGRVFSRHGLNVAQILLTREDFNSRARYLKIRNTIETLLKVGAVPVINENDSVAVDEIKFGDNDTLSALVASNIGADLLVLMSSMDGLYTKDPARSADARRISVVDRITGEISSLQGKSRLGGVGGIEAKIKAASIMMECGIAMAIVDASMDGVLWRLLGGEPVGTVFIPDRRLDNKLQWMLFSSARRGVVAIDEGAAERLAAGKASLLPSGIKSVKGIFKAGDMVSVASKGQAEIARGISNYSSDDIERIMGLQSRDIQKALGRKAPKEVIHHDNMVLAGSGSRAF